MCARVHFNPDIRPSDELGKRIMDAYRAMERREWEHYVRTGEIFPGDTAAVAVSDGAGGLRVEPMKWGIPSQKGSVLINARSETALHIPTFAESARERRCLLLANSYFEWQHTDNGKQKYEMTLEDYKLLYIACIFVEQTDSQAARFAVLTRDAAPALAVIHPRMPVVMPQFEANNWLIPGTSYEDGVNAALCDFCTRKV